jgi:S-adenosylmethionine:diacylglycerol 3-amino-3-carboxypropyl transferase
VSTLQNMKHEHEHFCHKYIYCSSLKRYNCVLSSADHAAVDFVHAQVQRDEKMRVLVAAGGGDGVLSLLTNPNVATVASVSSSGAQHHLTTLKLALALSDLPTEAIIKALGMELTADPVHPDAAAHRAELFSTSVLPALHKLNPATAAFWQDRIAREVAFGKYLHRPLLQDRSTVDCL